MAYGLDGGWTPLCKDGRIKGRATERQPLVDDSAALFYLGNQQLRRDEMVARFHIASRAIHRPVARREPATYAVTISGIRRTWP